MNNLNHIQPGLYPGLTFSEYRAHDRFGGSDAAYLATHSPAHWREHRKQPATPAMRFGTAAHCLILEGHDAFLSQYWLKTSKTQPDDPRPAITALDYERLLGMLDSVQNSTIANEILQSCPNREVSFFWECPLTDVECCGRLDFMGESIVGDLKTTADASPEAFLQSVKRYGYHIQASHYLDGLASIGCNDPARFLFIAIEKAPPYGIGIYELSDDLLSEGRRLANLARCKFREAEANGYWSSRDGIVKLSKNGETINLDL